MVSVFCCECVGVPGKWRLEEEEGKNAPCGGCVDKDPMLWGYVDSYDVNNERVGGGAADAPPFAFFPSPPSFLCGVSSPRFFSRLGGIGHARVWIQIVC